MPSIVRYRSVRETFRSIAEADNVCVVSLSGQNLIETTFFDMRESQIKHMVDQVREQIKDLIDNERDDTDPQHEFDMCLDIPVSVVSPEAAEASALFTQHVSSLKPFLVQSVVSAIVEMLERQAKADALEWHLNAVGVSNRCLPLESPSFNEPMLETVTSRDVAMQSGWTGGTELKG